MIKRILVPIDSSEASRNAALLAFELARALAAQVRCSTVIDVLQLPAPLRKSLPEVETGTDLERQIKKWIDAEFAKLTRDAGADVEIHITRGIAEEEILKTVRRYKPDLIVMGSIGIAK